MINIVDINSIFHTAYEISGLASSPARLLKTGKKNQVKIDTGFPVSGLIPDRH